MEPGLERSLRMRRTWGGVLAAGGVAGLIAARLSGTDRSGLYVLCAAILFLGIFRIAIASVLLRRRSPPPQ